MTVAGSWPHILPATTGSSTAYGLRVRPVISYKRGFTFPVAPAALWQAMERTEGFERWWSWLREFRLEGGALATGSVLHGVVVPPLPYRMRIDVEIIRCEPPSEIDAVVRGDLEGPARLRLEAVPAGTRAEVSWTIEMMQKPMRLASRIALPVLRLGHDAVVEMTVAGFRRQLLRDAPPS
jgi:hypothetical protein